MTQAPKHPFYPIFIMIRFDVLTLFPQIFASFLKESLLAKCISAGLIEVHTHDIRQWTRDKHSRVDDRPYGGGPGMLIQVQPVVDCVEAVQAMDEQPGQLLMMTPQGQVLRQPLVRELSLHRRLLLLCGRYEGFDQRVIEILKPREISLGDFILNGGEVAAMAVIESTMRLLPGALGDAQSSHQDSFSDQDLLEFPQYTRPREFRGYSVPDVLLSGNHQEIEAWRATQRQQATAHKRKDLL